MTSRSYKISRDPYEHAAMRTARRANSTTMKRAKLEHWSDYLSSLSPSSVWEAEILATSRQALRFPLFPDQDSPEDINNTLMAQFFAAKPPPILSTPTLSLF